MYICRRYTDNADFSKALQELEQCGFIRKFTAIGKKTKDATFQLIDNYTLFYFDFISENTNGDEHFWSSSAGSSIHYGWAGRAFERVCMQHVNQIKAALGFSAVVSSVHSWSYKETKNPVTGKTLTKGAQIDMLIDRNDDTINLCEMKYTSALTLLQKKRTTASATEGRPSSGKQAPRKRYSSR